MAGESLAGKIPDVYFDWYARLLPGSIAVAYYFFVSDTTPSITASYLFLYAAIGYAAGHIIQPPSSFLIRTFKRVLRSDEDKYNSVKTDISLDRQSRLVSKVYAEAVGMLSLSMLLTIIATYLEKWDFFTFLIVVYFFFSSVERTWSRKIKIDNI